jgi:hypothetical protein
MPVLQSIVLTKLRRGAILQIVSRYLFTSRKKAGINLYVWMSHFSHLIKHVHKAYCWRRQKFYSSYAFCTIQHQLLSACHTTDPYSIYRSFRIVRKFTVFICKQSRLCATHYKDFYLLFGLYLGVLLFDRVLRTQMYFHVINNCLYNWFWNTEFIAFLVRFFLCFLLSLVHKMQLSVMQFSLWQWHFWRN